MQILGPVEGMLANGEQGSGRMMDPGEIAKHLLATDSSPEQKRDLQGKRVLITAGPTYEDIDPVRFLGNRSSGRMGVAVAKEALARGASVDLILGPATVSPPPGCRVLRTRSAEDLRSAIGEKWERSDVVIMAAAVADYRPKQASANKQKKQDTFELELVQNPDILAELGGLRKGAKPILVGFALETEQLEERARQKVRAKKVDLIVGNSEESLDSDTSSALFATPTETRRFASSSKREVACRIFDWVSTMATE